MIALVSFKTLQSALIQRQFISLEEKSQDNMQRPS